MLNQFLPNGLGSVSIEGDVDQVDRFTAATLEYGLDASQGFGFASAGVPQSALGTVQRVSYNNFLGGCRLRLTNFGLTAQSATINTTRFDGTAILTNSPVMINAAGTIEINICSSDTQPAYGEVEVTPTQSMRITGELVRNNQDGSSELRLPLRER